MMMAELRMYIVNSLSLAGEIPEEQVPTGGIPWMMATAHG